MENNNEQAEDSYEDQYDQAMADLEAEEFGDTKPDVDDNHDVKQNSDADEQDDVKAKPEEEEEAESDPKEESPAEPDPLAELKAENEKLQQRLSETQNWGHKNAEEAKQLKQQVEEKERLKNRPEVLDDFDGLEDAIKYVAGANEVKPNEQVDPKIGWASSVNTAIPDVEELLADDAFFSKVESARQKAGEDWNNPLYAVRVLNDIKTSHLESKFEAQKQAAIAQAAKDFKVKQKRKSAMTVPGGSAGASPRMSDTDADAVRRIENMSDAEFDQEVNKASGL